MMLGKQTDNNQRSIVRGSFHWWKGEQWCCWNDTHLPRGGFIHCSKENCSVHERDRSVTQKRTHDSLCDTNIYRVFFFLKKNTWKNKGVLIVYLFKKSRIIGEKLDTSGVYNWLALRISQPGTAQSDKRFQNQCGLWFLLLGQQQD